MNSDNLFEFNLEYSELIPLKFKNFSYLPEKLEVFRDKNYHLKFKISYFYKDKQQSNEISNYFFHQNIGKKTKLTFIGKTKDSNYLVYGFNLLADQIDIPKNYTIVEGNLYKLIFRKIKSKKTESFTYWFLNSDKEFIYNENITFHPNIIKIGKEKEYKIESNKNSTIFKTHFNISYNNIKIEIGKAPEPKSENDQLTWIKSYLLQRPSNDIILSTISLFSFLTDTEFITLGNCSMDNTLNYNRASYINRFHFDLEHKLRKLNYHPIPGTNRYQPRIEKFEFSSFSELLKNYIEKRITFPLDEVIWLINQARNLPLDLQIHPLSTAFDLLKNSWFKSEYSSSKGKTKLNSELATILEEELNNLKKRLKDISSGDKIISKLKKSYTNVRK